MASDGYASRNSARRLAASLAVMLPLPQLAAATGLYILIFAWARVLKGAAQQVWRLKWLLLALFAVDWLVVSLDLAVVVTLRVILLSGIFALLISTTTPGEFRLALERLGLPAADCLALEDTRNGVLAASAAGVPMPVSSARGPATPASNWSAAS